MIEGRKPSFSVLSGGKLPEQRKITTFADLKQEKIVDISDIDFYAPHKGPDIPVQEIEDTGILLTFPLKSPVNSA
jgi:hypothetical protein